MPYEEADGVSHAEVQGLLHDNASCFEIGLATVNLALLPSNIEQIGEFLLLFHNGREQNVHVFGV